MWYEVWGVCCDVPSQWDGPGGEECLGSYAKYEDADRHAKNFQKGGNAAWVNTVK